MITLAHDLQSIHHDLGHRLATASAAVPDVNNPRDHYSAIDTFLAVASRHNSGMVEAIAPLVLRRPEGHDLAVEFLAASRRYEGSLAQVKAKLYGSTYAVRRSWPSIWSEVHDEFAAVLDLERQLVEVLLADSGADDDLAARLHQATLRAPTRPHPFIPHQGITGQVARFVARHVDRFWDGTEGRMVPEPVRHHEREHQGRLTQYLLADPHLPTTEE